MNSAANPGQYAEVIGVVLLTGFAIQQALQILDFPVSLGVGWYLLKHKLPATVSAADFKKVIMTAIAFAIAGAVVCLWDIRTLIYIDPPKFKNYLLGDRIITAFVLSAGTEGVNTLIKYFGYVKDARGLAVNPAAKVIPPAKVIGVE